MKLLTLASLLALGLAAHPGLSQAQSTDQEDRRITNTETFLASHPDLRYRLEGLDAYEKGRPEEALRQFTRAAKYADKPSQSMLGEMHWKGTGTAVNRPLGYAWMDLAAERGYPMMVAKREHYWTSMTEAERVQAIAVGEPIMAEYGDAAAQPRMALILKRAQRNVTGSRVGNVGNLEIQIPTAAGMRRVMGKDFYDDKFWKPEQYFEWHDKDWGRPGVGRVEVGELVSAEGEGTAEDELPAD